MAGIETPGYTDFDSSTESEACEISFPELACCSLNCNEGTTCCSIVVTGGVAPFSWETDKGVIVGSGTTVQLCMAVNAGSAVPGVAMGYFGHACIAAFPSCCCQSRGCDGSIIQACTNTGCSGIAVACQGSSSCACASCASCVGLQWRSSNGPSGNCCNLAVCGSGSLTTPNCCAQGCLFSNGSRCDMRTPSMISAGCSPCIIQFLTPATVTVTDALGNSAFCSVENLTTS